MIHRSPGSHDVRNNPPLDTPPPTPRVPAFASGGARSPPSASRLKSFVEIESHSRLPKEAGSVECVTLQDFYTVPDVTAQAYELLPPSAGPLRSRSTTSSTPALNEQRAGGSKGTRIAGVRQRAQVFTGIVTASEPSSSNYTSWDDQYPTRGSRSRIEHSRLGSVEHGTTTVFAWGRIAR